MTHVHVAAVRSIRIVVEESNQIKYITRDVIIMVELDQYRFKLSNYKKPLEEIRDSL